MKIHTFDLNKKCVTEGKYSDTYNKEFQASRITNFITTGKWNYHDYPADTKLETGVKVNINPS